MNKELVCSKLQGWWRKIAAKKELFINILFWTMVIGVNVYDFLGLCHLVPRHYTHVYRPFQDSASTYIFYNPRAFYEMYYGDAIHDQEQLMSADGQQPDEQVDQQGKEQNGEHEMVRERESEE
ncbi:uncharacterized protein LOC119668980 [Teleopsis dalmanni]|uniref:uncharacterized protein LOC119668980 n=1 Tax=Teleopsis dalmanni TaxID=139649 RepID=UPI0018CC7CDA|nr:uncharacterized protein LOC119668980 [Teleopsis dalmanni]